MKPTRENGERRVALEKSEVRRLIAARETAEDIATWTSDDDADTVAEGLQRLCERYGAKHLTEAGDLTPAAKRDEPGEGNEGET